MPIGSQLPSKPVKRKRSTEDESDSSSEDGFGPALPEIVPDDSSVKKARVIGPSLPPTLPAVSTPHATKAETEDGESSDDDDFGPSLPPPTEPKPDTTSTLPGKPDDEVTKAPVAPPKVQRDEWMTVAPTSGDWSQRIDPTKLKSRKFNTGRSSTTSSAVSNVWNETKEQKQARLHRENLGIKDDNAQRTTGALKSNEDEETARRMKEYNSQRGPSLYETHQKGNKIEEDDPSARAFDREKDIAGGLQINATKRREMVKKSADFNSRFSSAKYL